MWKGQSLCHRLPLWWVVWKAAGVSKRKLSISRPLFASDQCREISVAGIDELLQPWTTQRLIMPQEHAENNNDLVVFRRSKYTHFSQRKLPLCILNVTMTSVPFSTQSFFQTRTFLIRVMVDGLSAKLKSYLTDFPLEFWLKIWHNYYLGGVVLISGEIRKSMFSSQ